MPKQEQQSSKQGFDAMPIDESSIIRNPPNASSSRPSLLSPDFRKRDLRTPWDINDTGLKPVPAFYPPMDPRCTTFINDASPSIVAFRIADCLKKLSISVEYDEELASATCLTIDRVHFQIQLYRGGHCRPGVRNEEKDNEEVNDVDFSNAVIVEIIRSSGNCLSFHQHVRSILHAAMGQGVDSLPSIMTGPLEYSRLQHRSSAVIACGRKKAISIAEPLEQACLLLQKDRIGAQQLGMESLVSLTDTFTVGVETAIETSTAILGDIDDTASTTAIQDIRQFIFQLIQDRTLPSETKQDKLNKLGVLRADEESEATTTEDQPKERFIPPVDDTYHGGLLRSMALRVLTNALTVLSERKSSRLFQLLASSPFVSRNFLQALAEDLLGAPRLPAVVLGTRLASAHEAALVTRCLRLLSQYSSSARRLLVQPKNVDQPTLELLLKNKEVHHEFLKKETELAYTFLSEQVRTC